MGPTRRPSTQRKTVDLLDYLRRAAISDAERVRDDLRSLPTSELRDCLLEHSLYGGLARLARAQKTFRILRGALDNEYGASVDPLLDLLDHSLLQLPSRKAQAACAMIDDFVVRAVDDAEPQATPLLLEALRIPDELALVSEVVDKWGVDEPLASNCVVLACQHLLGSIIPEFNALATMGASFENMFVLGKVYSSNRPAALSLAARGVHVHPASLECDFQILRDPAGFEAAMKKAIEGLLEDAHQRLEGTRPWGFAA